MTAAVVTYRVKPGKAQEFSKQWKSKVAEIEGTAGLGPLVLLVDSEGKRFTSIAFWETTEHSKGWSRNPKYLGFVESVRDILVDEPVREYHEVSAASADAFMEMGGQKGVSRAA